MLNSIRFGFVFAGFGAFALFLGMASVAQAATCTATTGNWNTPGTWSGCGGGIPQAVDDVIVPSNVDVTVNVAGAVANTVTIQNAVGANNSIGINSPGTLTVTGTVSIAASTGAGSSSLSVVDGEVVAAGIIATGGGAAGVSQIVASAGTITSTNGITFAGNAANAQLNTYSSVTIILGGTTGTLGAGGTVSLLFTHKN